MDDQEVESDEDHQQENPRDQSCRVYDRRHFKEGTKLPRDEGPGNITQSATEEIYAKPDGSRGPTSSAR
jgi:hypothetical protein